MPIYQYECLNCGKQYDRYKKIKDRDNEKCECGDFPLRIISQTSKPIIMNYYSESIGEVIKGPAHRSRVMQEKHLEDV